ncbi:hypothetical protein O1L60_21500 [Streptomyces diastatochromogenes]|nr:hypothetical protein [Streptomyces diastatochromogenes]
MEYARRLRWLAEHPEAVETMGRRRCAMRGDELAGVGRADRRGVPGALGGVGQGGGTPLPRRPLSPGGTRRP